jgi:hypothetical protein
VSIAQRCHDPRRLLLKGYDHHQPATRADTSLVEALTPLERVGRAVVRRRYGDEHRVEVRGQFSVTFARIEDVLGQVSANKTTRTSSGVVISARSGRSVTRTPDHFVEAVWEVDLIEAHMRSALGMPQQLTPSRKPRCTIVNAFVYAPASGRLAALPFRDVMSDAGLGVIIDIAADVGQEVDGPGEIFSTELAEVYVGAKNLRRARSLAAEVLRDPPVVIPLATA